MREADIITRLIDLIKQGKKANAHVPFASLLDL